MTRHPYPGFLENSSLACSIRDLANVHVAEPTMLSCPGMAKTGSWCIQRTSACTLSDSMYVAVAIIDWRLSWVDVLLRQVQSKKLLNASVRLLITLNRRVGADLCRGEDYRRT